MINLWRIIMSRMKEHYMQRGYSGCCDGNPYCIDCDYYVSTEQYPKRWKPKQKTWYKKKTKDSEQKIRDYFKNKYKKKADFVCPF